MERRGEVKKEEWSTGERDGGKDRFPTYLCAFSYAGFGPYQAIPPENSWNLRQSHARTKRKFDGDP